MDSSVSPDSLVVILMPPGRGGSGVAYYSQHYKTPTDGYPDQRVAAVVAKPGMFHGAKPDLGTPHQHRWVDIRHATESHSL